MEKLLISLFDRTGNASRPYKENGWRVIQIDKQHGNDIMDFDPYKIINEYQFSLPEVGIIAMVPCDDYATCGAKHFKEKDSDGRTEKSQILVERTKDIINAFEDIGILKFWQIENPRTRIHNLNPWLKPVVQKFNPCDFAGYDPVHENSRYNKETWLLEDLIK